MALLDISVSVGLRAANGYEQRTGLHPAGVKAHIGYVHIHVAIGRR